MKAMAVIGYILAGLVFIGGLAISTNGNLPMQGFSAVIGGAAGAFMLALPSTALIGIVQIRNILKPDHSNDYKGWKSVASECRSPVHKTVRNGTGNTKAPAMAGAFNVWPTLVRC